MNPAGPTGPAQEIEDRDESERQKERRRVEGAVADDLCSPRDPRGVSRKHCGRAIDQHSRRRERNRADREFAGRRIHRRVSADSSAAHGPIGGDFSTGHGRLRTELRGRSRPKAHRAGGSGGGIGGGLYHSQSNEAWFVDQPGLKVVFPSTPYDAKGLLKASIRDGNPVIYFEHKKLYRSIKQDIPEEDYIVPIGKAQVRTKGDKVSIITYGLMVHYSLEAAAKLSKEGISAEVIDLRTLLPIDKETILESVKKTGKAVIVHEANKTGGVGGEIAAIIAEEAFEYLDAPVTRVAGPDIPTMPFAPPMEDFFMVNPEKIINAVRKVAAY